MCINSKGKWLEGGRTFLGDRRDPLLNIEKREGGWRGIYSGGEA